MKSYRIVFLSVYYLRVYQEITKFFKSTKTKPHTQSYKQKQRTNMVNNKNKIRFIRSWRHRDETCSIWNKYACGENSNIYNNWPTLIFPSCYETCQFDLYGWHWKHSVSSQFVCELQLWSFKSILFVIRNTIYDWIEKPNYIQLYYHMFVLLKFQSEREWEEMFKRLVNWISILMWPVSWIVHTKSTIFWKIAWIYEKSGIYDHFNSILFVLSIFWTYGRMILKNHTNFTRCSIRYTPMPI